MNLFGKVRKAARVGKGVASGISRMASSEERERAEYERLKAKFEPKTDAEMKAEWQRYYEAGCDGECETCDYYDWCPEDFVEEEGPAVPADEAPSEDSEDGLTDEERALRDAAAAYYEAGCDGECETCEYYDWCPAEEEVDEDDREIIAGMTQGDIKHLAEDGVNLAKETAMTAKELKQAMDDISSIFNPRKW